MFFKKSKKSAARPAQSLPVRPLIERLEERQMLSTVTNLDLSFSTFNSVVGQNLTFTAQVVPDKTRLTKPTGLVRFFAGSTLIGKIDINANGKAKLNISYLYKGTQIISAKYVGDSLYTTSTSGATQVNIVQGTTATASDGLRTETITAGTGAGAVNGNALSLDYYGYLNNGVEFDGTNLPGGGPFNFSLGVGQAIQGFDEGLQGMKVGETRELIIPAALGYKDQAQPASATRPGIPANSRLTFIVTLLSNNFVPSELAVTTGSGTPVTTNAPASTANGTAFGNISVGSISTPATFDLNAGNSAPINFTGSGTSVGGTNPTDFVVDYDSGVVTVTFKPTTTGLLTGVVKITTTDPNTPTFRILVSGTGV